VTTSLFAALDLAQSLSNEDLDSALAAEERRLHVAGEEGGSVLLDGLLRVQRARIAAGRALVAACESLEDEAGSDRARVGDRVRVALERFSDRKDYIGRVVAEYHRDGRDLIEVEYRQANGKIRTVTMTARSRYQG
jgi:hypothetical protein